MSQRAIKRATITIQSLADYGESEGMNVDSIKELLNKFYRQLGNNTPVQAPSQPRDSTLSKPGIVGHGE